MMHNSTLADHQLQRLFRSGLATHVADPATAGIDSAAIVAALHANGGDCVCVLADGRVAFSSVGGLPDQLQLASRVIVGDRADKVNEEPASPQFYSRRNPEFAANLMDQMAIGLTQISKGQALVNRLTYRFHVMEIALSRALTPPPVSASAVTDTQITMLQDGLDTLVARFDEVNARLDAMSDVIARNDAAASPDPTAPIAPLLDTFAVRIERALSRPAPAVDMTPIHAATARQATATSHVLARLEQIADSWDTQNSPVVPPEILTDLQAAIVAMHQPAPTTASDGVTAQLAQLTNQVGQIQSAITALPAAMAQPTSQRESFARFGVALQTVINRVENLAEHMTARSDHDAIHQMLSDISARIGVAEPTADPALDDLRARIDGIASALADTRSAISGLPAVMVAPVLQRESFARFGVALKTAIHRIEAVSDRLLQCAEQMQTPLAPAAQDPDALDEFLEDLRFATAELLAISLKDRAEAC